MGGNSVSNNGINNNLEVTDQFYPIIIIIK